MVQPSELGPEEFSASVTGTTDATVVSGVAQENGGISLQFHGGVGPYYYFLNGYSSEPTEITSPYDIAGVLGAFTYDLWVYDSIGYLNWGAFTPDAHTILLNPHVYREAFDWNAPHSQSHSAIPYGGSDISSDVSPNFPQFNAVVLGFPAAVLTSVDATIVSATIRNSYSIGNSASPASHHYSVFASSAIGMNLNSVQKVSGTITRPTQSGNVTAASTLVAGSPASTTVSGLTTNITDAPTLASLTGTGAILTTFTSTQPVADKTGSDAQISAAISSLGGLDCSWNMSVVYNYHVPRE